MKKLLLVGGMTFLLTACSDSENATPETTDTNVETASTEPATSEVEVDVQEANSGLELSKLEELIDSMAGWSSYHSITSIVESYENGEYPDSEVHVDKQYVVNPAQVYIFTSSIGFSNSQLEQYADHAAGGFESMDDGEFYDMENESVEIILKNGLPSRAELLHAVLRNTTNVSETDGTFDLTLDNALLEDIHQLMQASLFYNTSPDELDESIVDVLTMDSIYHAGTAKVITDGSTIVSYALTFSLTSDSSGPSTYTFSETFDRVNSIEETDTPEELMMGVGVN